MTGRRTKCTPELTKALEKVLLGGNYIEAACEFVGLGVSTYYLWCQRGRDELQRVDENRRAKVKKSERPFVEFLEVTTRARASAEIKSLKRIRKAAKKGDISCDKWFLERSNPNSWGRRKHDVTVDAPSVYMFLPEEDEDEE